MTVRIPKKVIEYFNSSDLLTVAVNDMSKYLNLFRLEGFALSNFVQEMTPVEIDESELDDDRLKDEQLFVQDFPFRKCMHSYLQSRCRI